VRILVTGGAGFIGSTTVDLLLADGHQVVVLDDFSTGREENLNPEAEVLRLGITDEAVLQAMAEWRFEAILHCAAQIDVRKSVENPVFDAGVNILGTLNLLEAARRTGVRRFVFSSTGGAIYGDTDHRPTPVGAECKPISPYGITKFAVEKYLYYYREVQGLSTFALRYGNVYGPRQNPHGEAGVVAIFARRLLKHLPLHINGDGTQTRDYVFVEDVARANVLALGADCGGAANVGTGVETDVNRLYERLAEALGSRHEAPHGPALAGEQRTSCLEWQATRELLGWEPRVDFAEGIARTAAWFRVRSEVAGRHA
jgi:UDP-glucose 4-epimerase